MKNKTFFLSTGASSGDRSFGKEQIIILETFPGLSTTTSIQTHLGAPGSIADTPIVHCAVPRSIHTLRDQVQRPWDVITPRYTSAESKNKNLLALIYCRHSRAKQGIKVQRGAAKLQKMQGKVLAGRPANVTTSRNVAVA